MTFKYDFHCHSHFSDGALSPKQLIDYASERDIHCLALTDHDSISGLSEASEYILSQQLPIKLINGVEISSLTEYGEIHIIGLAVDPLNKALINALNIQQEKRWLRAEVINESLIKAGVHGVLEYCKKEVKQVITRSHIAKAMVELEQVKDMQQAFKKYIGKQGRIKVPKNWMCLEEAIEVIKSAGGIPVLAHPTRYPLSNRKLSYLIQTFAQNGGEGIEMAYPSLNQDKMNWLKVHQKANELLASCGSDFHYPNLRWTDLGRYPRLDPTIPHVLDRLN
ncbi:PHP domain-containing protein [Aliikangiella sp. IMCC44359]|uniref:PHP domain-containing protein n=1 Tax=Aliikangiella sp. IMCC44359 TaxID=3459125 RepID=UPI00403AF2C0